MTTYAEYTTVADFRTTYQGALTTDTTQDALILQMIRAVSREMANGGRQYHPSIQTIYFDRAGGRQLDLTPWDVLEVTTFTNGDGSTISSTNYDLLPYYGPPYYAIRTKLTSGIVYLVDSSGNSEKALSLACVVGYSKDYASAWQLQTSVTGVITASGTSLTGLTSGELQAGQLLKLGSGNDYAYVSTASGTIATLVRSVNGSTGVSHGATDPISVWTPGYDLEILCKSAVQARLRLKDNPTGETVRIGNETFSTPKDVSAWLDKQMCLLGYEQPF